MLLLKMLSLIPLYYTRAKHWIRTWQNPPQSPTLCPYDSRQDKSNTHCPVPEEARAHSPCTGVSCYHSWCRRLIGEVVQSVIVKTDCETDDRWIVCSTIYHQDLLPALTWPPSSSLLPRPRQPPNTWFTLRPCPPLTSCSTVTVRLNFAIIWLILVVTIVLRIQLFCRQHQSE